MLSPRAAYPDDLDDSSGLVCPGVVFAERHGKKYPLSDLDLPATKSANEQRGVEFALPLR